MINLDLVDLAIDRMKMMAPSRRTDYVSPIKLLHALQTVAMDCENFKPQHAWGRWKERFDFDFCGHQACILKDTWWSGGRLILHGHEIRVSVDFASGEWETGQPTDEVLVELALLISAYD